MQQPSSLLLRFARGDWIEDVVRKANIVQTHDLPLRRIAVVILLCGVFAAGQNRVFDASTPGQKTTRLNGPWRYFPLMEMRNAGPDAGVIANEQAPKRKVAETALPDPAHLDHEPPPPDGMEGHEGHMPGADGGKMGGPAHKGHSSKGPPPHHGGGPPMDGPPFEAENTIAIPDDTEAASPDYDDSRWRLAGRLEHAGWYRLVVKPVSSHTAGALSLEIVGANRLWDLYVNGELLASHDHEFQRINFGPERVGVPIPPGAYDKDGNLHIALRLGQQTPRPGSERDTHMMLGSAGAIANDVSLGRSRDWLVTVPDIVLIVFSVVICLFLTRLYASAPEHPEYFWFAMYLLVSVGFSINDILPILHLEARWLVYSCVFAANVLSVQFVWTFFGRRLGWYARSVQVIACLGLLSLLSPRTEFGSFIPTLLALGSVLFVTVSRLHHGSTEEKAFGAVLVLTFGPSAFTLVVTLLRIFRIADWDGSLGLQLGPIPVDLSDIAGILTPFCMTLVLVRRFERTRQEEGRLRQEFEAARGLQALLVGQATVPGFEISAVYEPASEVGGDFYQILPTRNGGVLAILGDVSGKGLRAAMLVSLIVGSLRRTVKQSAGPGEILQALNAELAGQTGGGFVTCLCLEISPSGQVTAANAGHIPPSVSGKEVAVESGFPLGLAETAEYEETTFSLPPKQALVMISDGILEARDREGELFGFDRLAALLRKDPTAQIIADTARNFGQDDDLTVVTIRLTGE